MKLLKLLKSLPAKYAARRMMTTGEVEYKQLTDARVRRFCQAVSSSINPVYLMQRKAQLTQLIEVLPINYSIMLMVAVEKGNPGMLEKIRKSSRLVNERLDQMEKTEFIATLFLADRVRRCADTAHRIMGE